MEVHLDDHWILVDLLQQADLLSLKIFCFIICFSSSGVGERRTVRGGRGGVGFLQIEGGGRLSEDGRRRGCIGAWRVSAGKVGGG